MNETVTVRAARPGDAEAICSIYNAALAERSSTFETEPRSAADFLPRISDPRLPMLVSDSGQGATGWAGLSPHSDRACYAGIGEASVYVAPAARGHGVGTALASGLARAAVGHGFHKMIGKLFTDNRASIRLTERCGFSAVGLHRRHGQLDGVWRDVLVVERLLGADEPIRIVTYDPRWPQRFAEERTLLEDAIGSWVVGGIHHVGSTAVPGLDAKPIIDILVSVENLDSARACFEPLAKIDYQYAPYLPEEMHWFCKPHPSRREFHLHLVPISSERYADELAFRDCLRENREIAEQYTRLKHALAERFALDRETYTEAKGDFIRGALEAARAAASHRLCRKPRRK